MGWGGGQGVSPPRMMPTRYRIWSPASWFCLRPPAPPAAGHMLPPAVQRVFLFHFSLPASPSHPDPGHCASLGGRHGPSPGVGAKVGPALPGRQTGGGGGCLRGNRRSSGCQSASSSQLSLIQGVFSPSNPYHARGSSSTVIPSDTKVEGMGHLEGPSTLVDAVCWGGRSPEGGQGWRLNKPKPRLCWRQRLGPLSDGRSWTKYYCWVTSRPSGRRGQTPSSDP